MLESLKIICRPKRPENWKKKKFLSKNKGNIKLLFSVVSLDPSIGVMGASPSDQALLPGRKEWLQKKGWKLSLKLEVSYWVIVFCLGLIIFDVNSQWLLKFYVFTTLLIFAIGKTPLIFTVHSLRLIKL